MLNCMKGLRDEDVGGCLVGNEGSRRLILKNGGVYESTVHEPMNDINLERYWIRLN